MMVRLALGMPAAAAAEAALEKSRQAMTTCQSPLWPSARAAARPRPEDAPVIITCPTGKEPVRHSEAGCMQDVTC